ncbi:serine/threonine-protein kinase atr [Oryzias melastigma]|uniref:serine/threonine-protein kinase atr n=1 Tax=Oryzias melastigma TaxID=30732 RepID=UPI000CF8035C|nr:serine/threonine-protein kinase atr [Oryzias melastigma]XP_036067132.1 serine/threonine-protein kinase atr [Oryzias melastigma]XP_036067133.1 serine/threonine-protein kinase atr [Oryzias melastigma]XP_036067134.1 serine/threonine-protein kinase atr [Oryzias melastigma]XP_036067135.1 serine/threonine-protein kinase atr [Oryzias melastigma]XP_036067136.1 serine/threonine-protein kinase atr [Oryzias melastigma]
MITGFLKISLCTSIGARLEDRLYEHLEWIAPPRLQAHELLVEEMIRAGLEVGSTTPYGTALMRCGETQKQLGETERKFVQSSNIDFLTPLRSFTEGEYRTIQSSYQMRMNRCNQILQKAVSLKQSLYKFIGDANRLTDKLLELCNKPVDGNSTTLSIKQLKRLVEETTFSQILIPLQSVLIPTRPSTGGTNGKHDAFLGHSAYLDGFEDVVEILASLQKPK